MPIQWDITQDVSAQSFGVDMQQPRVRAKSKATGFAVLATVAGTLVFGSAITVITLQPVRQSSAVISVQSVPRSQPMPASCMRADRAEYAPDGQHGLSTARLGEMFPLLFAPTEEAEPDIDYSFG